MTRFSLLKRLVGAALAAGLLMTTAGAFTDTEGYWGESAITKWSEEYNLIQGYEDGTFRPENPITRGAFAGILDRFLQFRSISPADTFSDTEGTYWEEAILKLNAAGVYLGNGGKALPTASITRQQAVTMIARAFHIEASVTDLPYTDADQIAEYARPAIAEMTVQGYLNDSFGGNFRPNEPITRAELVNILDNMIQTLVQTPETYSEDTYGTLMINSTGGATLSDMLIMGDLILAPGVEGDVTLCNVDIEGSIRNFSSVEPTVVKKLPEEEENPAEEDVPAITPEEVYTPGQTTGETILYSGKEIPVYEGVEKSRLYDGDFCWDGDRLEYIGSDFRTRFGIDVSAYQNRSSENNTIDWEAVADDGVDFVMVRIGLRGTSTGLLYEDEYFVENIQGAIAAGIETGVYFFAQAITVEEALEEAEFVLELLDRLDVVIDGPVAYDWEMHDSSYRVYGTAPEMATACAVAFCQRIEEAGYEAMVYAGQYVSYIKYDQSAIAPYLAWYPEYKSESSELLYPTFYYQVDYWQFSSSCSIAGIGGRVDANLQFISR